MPTIKISLDTESFRALADVAIEQRRAVPLQAEVLALQALGRWPVPEAHLAGNASQPVREPNA
jgi:hypothetical protein